MNKNEQLQCATLCTKCSLLTINEDSNECSGESPKEKCSQWLQKCSFSECESNFGTEDDSCVSVLSTDDSSSYSDLNEKELTISNQIIDSLGEAVSSDLSILNGVRNNYKNVTISKSKNIHLGNVTYINGPVYVNQTASIVNKQTTVNQFILNDDIDIPAPKIIDRKSWLAQPPIGKREFLKRPAQLVIICHTATEEAYSQPDNILLIRLIQQFHIESRKWDDIGYHFLIGADGNIYEGRGWGVIGAHTYGYNSNSIGLAFVGCYTHHLPPAMSMTKAKKFIEYGVKIGAIDQDYQLLAHSQCTTTESPGEKLREEIRTWHNWNPNVSIENPPPLA